jgi:hypothetical protein
MLRLVFAVGRMIYACSSAAVPILGIHRSADVEGGPIWSSSDRRTHGGLCGE